MSRLTFYLRATLSILIFGLLWNVPSRAQQPPTNASKMSNGVAAAWAPNSQVTVFVDSELYAPGSANYNALVQGLTSDQQAYSYQGVTFSFQSYDSNVACPVLGTNQMSVTYGTFDDPTQYGVNNIAAYFSGPYGYNVITSSAITLDPNQLTTTSGVTYAGSHEGSHDFFLGDCPTCDNTIMTYNVDVNNPPYMSPQQNDVSVAYQTGGGWE